MQLYRSTRSFLLVASLSISTVWAAAPTNVAGSYTLQGNKGPIVLHLDQDAEGKVSGSLKGGTLSLTLKVFPKEGGGVLGTASDPEGNFASFFQISREGGRLVLDLIEANADGDPDFEKKTRIPFPASQGKAPASDSKVKAGDAPFAGTFKGEDLTLESKSAVGQYRGVIQMEGKSYPFTATEKDGTLSGGFQSPDGKFDFTAKLNGPTLVFETEGTTFTLARQTPASARPANPLAKGKPAASNPLKKPAGAPPAAKGTTSPAKGTPTPAKGAAAKIAEPTGGPGSGPAWKLHQHATGLSMRYPPSWKLNPLEGALQLVPPDVTSTASGPTEAYFVLGEGAEGVSSPEDPRVVAFLEQQVQQIAPFLQRAGGVEKIKAATAPGILVTWEGQSPTGMALRAQAHTTILKGYGITLFTLGVKEKIAAREKTVRSIFSSFAAGEGKRDPQLVGAWRFWSYKASADGKFGTERSSQMVLHANGQCQWSGKSESSGSFSNSQIQGSYAGSSGDADRGTWTAANGELYIMWNDGSVSTWDYQVSGAPGGRKMLLKGSGNKPDEWMEIQ
ncbi:MAG: hypothetical protein KY468_02150 [Armatimonadetes bacterium]|nr:hypothetical protein [Armatimonadota bacterium]